jgi:hypothetical protein
LIRFASSLLQLQPDGLVLLRRHPSPRAANRRCKKILFLQPQPKSASVAFFRFSLTGPVEADETFVGRKAKSAVVALVERRGLARVKVTAAVIQKNLGAALCEGVSQEATVHTDEPPS